LQKKKIVNKTIEMAVVEINKEEFISLIIL
jgi:hypothetical protein